VVGEKVPGPCNFLLKEKNTVYHWGFLLSPEQQPVLNKQQERMMPPLQASSSETSLSIPHIEFTRRYLCSLPGSCRANTMALFVGRRSLLGGYIPGSGMHEMISNGY
jgi:hypothetical protein